jgi:hypothetical protein
MLDSELQITVVDRKTLIGSIDVDVISQEIIE